MKPTLTIAEKVANETAGTKERSIYTDAYEVLKEVKLEALTTSVNVSALAKIDSQTTIAEVLKGISKDNYETEKKNLSALNAAFGAWFKKCNYTYSEKRCFLIKLSRVMTATHNFKLTFQAERTEDTTNVYEDGAFFARPTTVSAAGIRTSFNSVEYTRRTAAQLAERARKAKELEDAKSLLLAHGMPENVIDNMPATAIHATAKAFGM